MTIMCSDYEFMVNWAMVGFEVGVCMKAMTHRSMLSLCVAILIEKMFTMAHQGP